MAKISARGATEVARFDTGSQRFVYCSDRRILMAIKVDSRFTENKLWRKDVPQEQWDKFRASFKTCMFCGHLRQKCTVYKITEADFNHKDYRNGMAPALIPTKTYNHDICPDCRVKQEAMDQSAGLNPQ